ncbi:hypothetical protein FHG87_013859 [Trinorchestia longiramus]|nr:hypothetical protein FHG87_013859 [Trinorchestia longiramus]
MNRIKFLPLCLSVAVMQSPVSSSNEEPFGPSLPDDTVFKLIPTSTVTAMLTVVENRRGNDETSEECQQRAILNGAHFFLFRQDYCNYGTLLYPICSTPSGNEYELLHVAEKFVTDGSPSDGAILKPLMTAQMMQSVPHQSFRVETPTILQIPEFITELGEQLRYITFDNVHTSSVLCCE